MNSDAVSEEKKHAHHICKKTWLTQKIKAHFQEIAPYDQPLGTQRQNSLHFKGGQKIELQASLWNVSKK